MTIVVPTAAHAAFLPTESMGFGRAQGGNRDAFRSLRRCADVLDERDQSARSSLPPEEEAVAGETTADVDTGCRLPIGSDRAAGHPPIG
jgi:hypothetical protein